MDIPFRVYQMPEFAWVDLATERVAFIMMFFYIHLVAVFVGALVTYYGISTRTSTVTTIVSLFRKSGWIGWSFIICTIIITKYIGNDFRLSCWMEMLEFTKLNQFFNWRICSLAIGASLSWFCNRYMEGNFVTDGSALLFLFPIDSIDLGFSLMRQNIRAPENVKTIIVIALMNFVGSTCVVSILTWYTMPFWISGITFLDCLAFGAICSCVDPSFCNKSLGLERRTTHSLHCSFVGESVVSSFLGGLIVLWIQYQINCPIFWHCLISIIIYLLSGFLGKLQGQIYSATWNNYEQIFFQEIPRSLYQVSLGIWVVLFVALSIVSWLPLDLGMAALTFSTTIVRLTDLPPLATYNDISSYLDVGGYMRMGIFAFHKLHSWTGYVLVCMGLLCTTILGRLPAVALHFYLNGRGVRIAELWIVWLAGIVQGASSLSFALTVFGAALNERGNTVLMSATISIVLVTHVIIGPFSTWIVSREFPPTEEDEMDENARIPTEEDEIDNLNARIPTEEDEIDNLNARMGYLNMNN